MWVYVYQANRAISPMSTTKTVGGQTIEIYDGQYFLQDETDQYSMWTWERTYGYWERVKVANSGVAKKYDISVLPAGGGYGGETHKLIRLDYFNCDQYNMCIPTTWGAYYSLRRDINLYTDSGGYAGVIPASTHDIVFDAGYGFTKATSTSGLSASGVGIRVSGHRNKSTGAVTKFASVLYASENMSLHPADYAVNTF